ncbi:aminoacylase [Marchantia polymorpha subsp. ruderalis]|uniref:N-acyl-aliphatic-L-amino acid amidohydrolase n=2 Tax=Marchantia polymorpha TaxID=3197 RepID=A0A176W631_MARPO|nr:hypothetical protein AXG93_2175s1230 [Marchantia polymorpha subsp. ruderalis]PTQ35200.1 hypothetical protein MARPO_0073s0071 [Marchantia polymorpha]BBN12275.1 hypothetical protein Mp_5g18690 [Marchantia polymorpha subsp. ruderalis]|eukprot:PTQ35200.1 hypothetical protein MARPO_0073s0071 [Marchantia polymorpha]
MEAISNSAGFAGMGSGRLRGCVLGLLVLLVLSCEQMVVGVDLSDKEQASVARFQEYLKIDTVHPFPNYFPVTDFLIGQAKQIGLDIKVLEYAQAKPVVLMSWEGTEPLLPSVLLNSHTDVVPVEFANWKYPPFSATMDEAGNIYARGSQDMKCVGMQYLEAIRSLKASGYKPQRSIHVSFVPDEEIGGSDGAQKFYESEDFTELNVALVLDEGLASEDNNYRVFYAERSVWWFYITAKGHPGHGSRLLEGMAMENLRISLDKIAEFRTSEFDKVKSGEKAEGEVISVNNVYLTAGTPTPTGFVMNLQPSEAEAGFDMRLPPIVDTDALQKRMDEEWAPASRNVTCRFIQKKGVLNKFGKPSMTLLDELNPWWPLFQESVAKAGGKLARPEIFMASTDARFPRFQGIPAIGFSPMSNTPILLHDNNEFLNVKEYLKGVKVYEQILQSFTSPTEETPSKSSTGAFTETIHSEL